MAQFELLNKVTTVLDGAGVDYMLTGSHASSLQGEPRSTHDIDLIVDMRESAVPQLLAAFTPPDYYLSEASIREAIQHRSMFNLLDLTEGDKVDFWLLTDDAFDQARFQRKQIAQLDDSTVKTSSPEDTILSKLRWAQLSGGSEKQFRDALGVYEFQRESLDHNYLRRWAKQLDVVALWERLVDAALGDA